MARTLHIVRWQVLLALDQDREPRFIVFSPGGVIRFREVPVLEEMLQRQLLWPTFPLSESQRAFVCA
jgi:hypothetical protein